MPRMCRADRSPGMSDPESHCTSLSSAPCEAAGRGPLAAAFSPSLVRTFHIDSSFPFTHLQPPAGSWRAVCCRGWRCTARCRRAWCRSFCRRSRRRTSGLRRWRPTCCRCSWGSAPPARPRCRRCEVRLSLHLHRSASRLATSLLQVQLWAAGTLVLPRSEANFL